VKFTNEQVLAIARMVMETECGYCMDGADLEGPVCPECGAEKASEYAGGEENVLLREV
jgi:hypothetical protein